MRTIPSNASTSSCAEDGGSTAGRGGSGAGAGPVAGVVGSGAGVGGPALKESATRVREAVRSRSLVMGFRENAHKGTPQTPEWQEVPKLLCFFATGISSWNGKLKRCSARQHRLSAETRTRWRYTRMAGYGITRLMSNESEESSALKSCHAPSGG